MHGAAAALAVVVASIGLATVPAPSAQAATLPFTINDLRVIPDENPGDGICGNSAYQESGAPACTLYGALQEANALSAADTATITAGATMYDPVSASMVTEGVMHLDVFDNASPAGDAAIWNPESVDTMVNTNADDVLGQSWDGDFYVAYLVDHDGVTIDFDNRIGTTANNNPQQVTLAFNAADGTLQNFNAISTGEALTSSEGVVTVGANATNTTISNGRISNFGTFNAERGVTITEGSGDVTIDSVTFNQLFQANVIFAGIGSANFPNPGTTGQVTISNSNFDLSDPIGGDSYGIDSWFSPDTITGLSVTDSTFTDLTIGTGSVVNMVGDVSLGSFTFTGNTVDATTAASTQPGQALYFSTSSTSPIGDMTISGNDFLGASTNTIHLQSVTPVTGSVVVDGNTVTGANGAENTFLFLDSTGAASPLVQVTNNSITGFNTNVVWFEWGDYDAIDISGNTIDASANPGIRAVWFTSPQLTANTTAINNNTILGLDYSVVSDDSEGLGAMIVTGNIFDNTVDPGPSAFYIIHNGSLDSFTATDNQFLGYTYRAIDYEYGGPATGGVTITGNTFDSSAVAGGGDVAIAVSTEADPITGLTISGNTFTDIERSVYLYAFDVSDMSITDNTFTQNQSALKNQIFIEPSVEFTGENVITGNSFAQNVAATPGVSDDQAFIHWSADAGSTPGATGFVGTIADNRFDGGAVSSAILLQGDQLFSVVRNTAAGIGDSSQQTVANENSVNVFNPVSNWDTVNDRPQTAYPTAASVCGTGVVVNLDYSAPGPGGNTIAGAILVDVYASTAADGMAMDRYIGQISTTVESLPATFVIPTTSAIAGDIRAGGLVRVQTILDGGTVDGTVVPAGTTSQLSRIITADDSLGCPIDLEASSFDVTLGMQAPDGVAAHTVTVNLVDIEGNPATGYASFLAAATAAGTVTFGAWVDNGDGSYTASATSTTAGAFPVTITLGGDAITSVVANDTALFGVPPVIDLEASLYEVTSGTKAPNGTAAHTLTVTLFDTDGNRVIGMANLLTPMESTGTVTFGAWVDNGDGTYSASITSTKAGAYPITVSFNGEPLSFVINDTARFAEPAAGLATTGANGLEASVLLVAMLLMAGLVLMRRRRTAE